MSALVSASGGGANDAEMRQEGKIEIAVRRNAMLHPAATISTAVRAVSHAASRGGFSPVAKFWRDAAQPARVCNPAPSIPAFIGSWTLVATALAFTPMLLLVWLVASLIFRGRKVGD
jgi:hypothetical protein